MATHDINVTGTASILEQPDGRYVIVTPDRNVDVPLGSRVIINGQVVIQGNPTVEHPQPTISSRRLAQQNPEFVQIHRVEELQTIEYLQREEIQTWREIFATTPINNEEVFYTMKGYYEARKHLWFHGWVTISSHPGDGKTTLAEKIAVTFVRKPFTFHRDANSGEKEHYKKNSFDEEDRGIYECVKVNSPEEWHQKVKPDKDQVVLLDDIFGPASFSISRVEEWKPILEDIYNLATERRPHCLVIITIHKHQLDKLPPEVRRIPFFKPHAQIDLIETQHNPDSFDRRNILTPNCEYYNHKISYRDEDDFKTGNLYQAFPLACRMYAQIRSFHMEGQIFFKNPERSFSNVIDKVFSFDKTVMFTLASAVLFDGCLELDKYSFEDYSDRQQNVFRQLRQLLEVPDEIGLPQIRFAAEVLNGVFFHPKYLHCWQFSHERIMHLVAEALAKKYPNKMVELCSINFLMERYRTSNYFAGTLESTIHVYNKEFEELSQRFTFEILSGNMRIIASHPSLSDAKFAESWFTFMADMGSILPVAYQKGPYNRSIFYWLCFYGHEASVNHFLTHEDLEEVREEQWFKDEKNLSLLAACGGFSINGNGTGKVVKLLLENGVPLTYNETLSEEDCTELFGFVTSYLIKIRAPIIHIAASRCNFETINNLAEKGVDINEPSSDGWYPLHRAANNIEDGAARALVKLKADASKKTPSGKIPLHMAMLTGYENQTRQINWAGSHVKEGFMDNGFSYLYSAVSLDDEKVGRLITNNLMDYSGNPSKDPMSPLHCAAALGNIDMCQTLADKDKPELINKKCTGGFTPLHFAVLFYHDDVIRLLVSMKADVNAVDDNKKSPFHLACEHGYIEICNYLLENGAKPELLTKDGELPITLAAKNKHVELVKLLIKEGIELEMPKMRDENPRDRQEMTRMLMMMGLPKYRDRFK